MSGENDVEMHDEDPVEDIDESEEEVDETDDEDEEVPENQRQVS